MSHLFHFKKENKFLKESSKLFFILGILVLLPLATVNAQNVEEQKEDLRGQISEIEGEIKGYEEEIYVAQKKERSLKNEVGILSNQIRKEELEQRALGLSLRDIEDDVNFKNEEIVRLNEDLGKKKELLTEAIKEINNHDKIGWFELVLTGNNISDIFGQIQNIYNLQKKVNVFIQNIDDLRGTLKDEKSILEERKIENVKLKSLSNLQEESLQRKKTGKNSLIKRTRGNEQRYQNLVKKSKRDITVIKQQLYRLEDVGVSMSFEEAYNRAKFVGEKTGVRSAFILGLFQVESRLGTYIGGGSWKADLYQCYINLGKRTRAEREKKAFLDITSSLGLDPDAMPVSKRLASVGCGGAMGAAQFMPTTWAAYKNQIASLTGNNPPSPWNIEDAFMGSAIKLSNNGANTQTVAAEKKAAAMYYAGSRWRRYPGQNYARQVLSWADYYQGEINAIESGPNAIKL